MWRKKNKLNKHTVHCSNDEHIFRVHTNVAAAAAAKCTSLCYKRIFLACMVIVVSLLFHKCPSVVLDVVVVIVLSLREVKNISVSLSLFFSLVFVNLIRSKTKRACIFSYSINSLLWHAQRAHIFARTRWIYNANKWKYLRYSQRQTFNSYLTARTPSHSFDRSPASPLAYSRDTCMYAGIFCMCCCILVRLC